MIISYCPVLLPDANITFAWVLVQGVNVTPERVWYIAMHYGTMGVGGKAIQNPENVMVLFEFSTMFRHSFSLVQHFSADVRVYFEPFPTETLHFKECFVMWYKPSHFGKIDIFSGPKIFE